MTLRTEPKAVVIPNQALQISQQGNYVWLVKDDHTVIMRPVKIDRRIGNELVIAQGLTGGETVVTEGQMRLDTGARVDIEKPADSGSGAGATP